jgi:phosphoglycolate phosphatase
MARIIFDLDGTLVDSAPSLTAASNAMLAELGRPPLPVDTVKSFIGNGIAKLVERVLVASGGMPEAGYDASLARYREIYFSDPVTGTVVYPGVHAALEDLAGDGHGLAVCTQKTTAPALRILGDLNLMPPISGLTGGDAVGVLKPDPAMLWHAADQLPHGEVVYVGDSGTDAKTAEAAGVPFLLHAHGYCHVPLESLSAVAIFEHFGEVPGLVRQVLERRAAS